MLAALHLPAEIELGALLPLAAPLAAVQAALTLTLTLALTLPLTLPLHRHRSPLTAHLSPLTFHPHPHQSGDCSKKVVVADCGEIAPSDPSFLEKD